MREHFFEHGEETNSDSAEEYLIKASEGINNPKALKKYETDEDDNDMIYYLPETGEIVFKITPEVSKRIKPGAFYNFSILANAFDLRTPTEYKKLTDNGAIHLEYGAQDITVKPSADEAKYNNIESIKLLVA